MKLRNFILFCLKKKKEKERAQTQQQKKKEKIFSKKEDLIQTTEKGQQANIKQITNVQRKRVWKVIVWYIKASFAG